jgi:uncharacterized protein
MLRSTSKEGAMARSYYEIAFTPSVKAAQEHYGSRLQYARAGTTVPGDAGMGEAEAAFITARDGFYLASVGETGWPYLQFRGGPPGFVRVLDATTLAYADFRGNRQYISVGNTAAEDRVALFFMDYANRRRLKVMARARFAEPGEEPVLAELVALPGYRARVERIAILRVEAFDWNCPQHITPRFTESEIAGMVRPLHDRILELEAELASLRRPQQSAP